MINKTIESTYPISFRKDDASALGTHIRNGHSLELIAMKRAGISNFLRYFITNENVQKTFINHNLKILFVQVDLNDLIEREVFPFWRLTFKRLVDNIEKTDIDETIKKRSSTLFLNNIQTGDLFLTLDAIRDVLKLVTENNYKTVFFFIGFDRLTDVVNKAFLDNLISLHESASKQATYIFTSFRELSELAPNAMDKQNTNAFIQPLFLKPVSGSDNEIIYDTLASQYERKIDENLKKTIIEMSGGHVQYLQLSIIILNDPNIEFEGLKSDEIIEKIVSDERIQLQSEELYNHLTIPEQKVLEKIIVGEKVSESDIETAQYLWNTGIIIKSGKKNTIFSKYFELFLKSLDENKSNQNNEETHLTKKEYLLYTLLENNKNEICDREKIVEVVWPEYSQYGVSDWSIDRLVSRLRKKIELQNSNFKIETIRTRGFRLMEK